MKNIKICDRTLCTAGAHFSFKEKIEIARQLERLNVTAVELPEIENAKTDTLLVRTVASFVKNSVLSVCGGKTCESIDLAADARAPPQNRVFALSCRFLPWVWNIYATKKRLKWASL